jgi:hypothetical protein
MNEQTANADKPVIVARFFRWLFSWRTIRRALIALACFTTVVALFYTEENWRGKRAWENCKRELGAKGAVLDWNVYIPPPVPDDQNFFKAPGIKEADWVGRGSKELNKRLSSVWQPNTNSMLVAELTIVPPRSARDSKSAETILRLEEPTVQAQAEQLVRSVLGPSLTGAHGFYPLVARPLNQIKPIAVVVPSDKMPTAKEILAIFPATIGGSHLQIKPVGTNSFRVLLDPSAVAANDYLRASDSFEADFDTLREALKRPYTRMDGDYSQPAAMPIPNFITLRTVAQVLAERTKCYLLLGQPDKALRELTLFHDVCRILESRPTGKPMTLVAAMINVAISGLYVSTVEDGMRLQVWREPQLATLEKQLSEINLLPHVFSAFEQEPVAVCRSLETLPASKFAAMIFFSPPNPTLWEKLKNLTYLLINWMPRGWVYQNMVNIAMRSQKIVGGFDPSNHLVLPRKVETSNREMETFRLRRRPYTFLAAISVPNYVRATQTLAHNQTLANQTLLACALERYHLARGQFPESPEALAPQFIEKIPHDLIGGQPLKYRRTDDGKFLLYSIGWNEKDDGGVVAPNKDGKEDLENGDWVWRYPAE